MHSIEINYTDLRDQKDSLQFAIHSMEALGHNEEAKNLTGLLHLVDAIQDNAVDVLGMSEKEVFDT